MEFKYGYWKVSFQLRQNKMLSKTISQEDADWVQLTE